MVDDNATVWVFDTSALVAFKVLISVDQQWAAFKSFEEMAIDGAIAMPRQVINEASNLAYPDLPGVWVPGMRPLLAQTLDADDGCIQAVMAAAGDVVDESKSTEDADPWVVALAIDIAHVDRSRCRRHRGLRRSSADQNRTHDCVHPSGRGPLPSA